MFGPNWNADHPNEGIPSAYYLKNVIVRLKIEP